MIEPANAERAVLGGEWWTVLEADVIWPAIPALVGGSWRGICSWSTRLGWDRGGSWEAFCKRSAAYDLAVLQGEDPDSTSLPAIEDAVRHESPDLWPRVHYNITSTDRERYERLKTTCL